MTATDRRAALAEALRGRLDAVAVLIEPETPASSEEDTAALLQRLAASVRRSGRADHAWLLFVGITGAYPDAGDLDELRRRLDLAAEGAAIVAALGATAPIAAAAQIGLRRLEIVEGAVLADVDFCAKHEHNTGIQRVVRETLSRWEQADRPVVTVAWTSDASAWRRLTEAEADRVFHWSDRRRPAEVPADDEAVIVPWNCRILLAEVPFQHLLGRIAAVARSSGNRVTAIGYDAIPLVSAEGQPSAESERFAHYLAAIKHADHIIGISESAAEEFRGFVSALPSQGLVGPRVTAIPLAVEVPRVELAPREEGRRLVMCVGSHEPRKNQDAVLAAAEALYEEGERFELVFVGGGSRSATMRFDERVARLARRGFQVSSHRRLSDERLFGLFAAARFSVFVSLHEGFGLPVAESIALGVPVLTSDYGSLAEIAALGGCVTVDPRDDDAILEAMRRMLVDDELIDTLREQAAAAPRRGWNDYADDLWSELTSEGVGA